MSIESLFAPGVSLRDFMMKNLSQLHDARKERFNKLVKAPLIVSYWATDIDERYTSRADSDGIEVEDDEMIDFPVVTIKGDIDETWEETKTHLLELMNLLDARDDIVEAGKPLTQAFLDEFEKFDGVIHVEMTGLESKDSADIFIVFNDYDSDLKPSFKVTVPIDLVYRVAKAELNPEQAAKTVKLSGDKKFALNLTGLIMKHFDPSA